MTTVVLQAVGGAIGSVFGPVGTAIGSALGAMGGYMVDSAIINSTRRIEGPRLANAKPLTAEEGAALPLIYGTARVSGTLIWATRFEEDKTTERQGGKGGPKVTTYSYFVNAAFAVAEGEIAGIRRVWADGKEIDLTSVEMRIYKGTSDQQPDPLIEAKQGEGNAPAYRGTAYVVIERFPVDEYGHRIPQLQFEVIRTVGKLAKSVKAVTLLPGATEFGLSPFLISDESAPGQKRLINRNNLREYSDWAASMNELQALCPQLQHVAIIVPWFGDDLRAGHCKLKPAVTELNARKPSRHWRVNNISRQNAHHISRHNNEAAYGGTPSDDTVIEAIRDAKKRGLSVTLYPFIMMDIAADNQLPSPYGGNQQPAYPWRGRITCHPAIGQAESVDKTATAAGQISQFVEGEWGYRRFLNHCADLAVRAGGVDAFLVGSELIGLTHVRSSREVFPFVDALCDLAGAMRAKLGSSCKITYAADWSEYFGYQAQDGTGDVFYHLDPLWAHSAIHAIGIDNYMPLSDWRDQDWHIDNPDGFAAPYDLDALKGQIAAGEGYHWYYVSGQDRKNRIRTPITDGLAGKPWVFRYKDLHSWWGNAHYNRVNGAEKASPTAWVPMSKPFWLTELGCPAVDKGPNQPNVFPDAKSSENAVPYFSNAARSDLAMDRFLRAHLAYWPEEGAHNPVSPLYGGKMLDDERIYLWAWDTRPFPEFPLYNHYWGDAANWSRGHWLNGRLSQVPLDELIAQIIKDFGLPEVDSTQADGFVHGFVISDPTTARSVLEPLLDIFGVHAFEQDGKFIFKSLDRRQEAVRIIDDIVVPDEADALTITLEDKNDLPRHATLFYQDPMRDYQAAGAKASQEKGEGDESISLSGSLERGAADGLAEQWLLRRWAQRRSVSFAVPWARAQFHVGDRVKLPIVNGNRDYVITSLEDGEVRQIQAVALAPRIDISDEGEIPFKPDPAPVLDVKPVVHLIDLPLWPGAQAAHQQLRVACHAKPWRGVAAYVSPQEDGFTERTLITSRAIMGELLQPFIPDQASGRLMRGYHLDIVLYAGELHSCTMQQLYNGANTALIKTPDGEWEVLQFLNAEEIANGHWRLFDFLRGQLGTEAQSLVEKQAEAPFILLDAAIVPVGLDAAEIGLQLNWRLGTAGRPFTSDYFETITATGGMRALSPLSPVHLRAKTNGGDTSFSWIRRGRIDADSWLADDIVIGEERERYHVELWQGGQKIWGGEVGEQNWVLTASHRQALWGSAPVNAEFKVAMVSAQAGSGDFATLHLTL
ncbi:baseplate multidomain protein megatron [Paenochrobactrum glaciei]|uniref:Glycoside hydrolase TIM-barrel-like domain-containing protein n=1 Tax=Paenochrobactrum glaciei TaxID=486407 RepID=A0ABN1FIR9_9HYPH